MVNRKMRFVWNVGAGIGEVTHPLHIQTAGDLSKDQHWYRVEAERSFNIFTFIKCSRFLIISVIFTVYIYFRVSNIGQLWVRPVVVPEGSSMANTPPAVNSSTPGAGRLDVGKGDRVWVGGADRRHPHLKSTQSGLVGCLHQLYLNGRPIGLWDFSTQNPNSCTACVEGLVCECAFLLLMFLNSSIYLVLSSSIFRCRGVSSNLIISEMWGSSSQSPSVMEGLPPLGPTLPLSSFTVL